VSSTALAYLAPPLLKGEGQGEGDSQIPTTGASSMQFRRVAYRLVIIVRNVVGIQHFQHGPEAATIAVIAVGVLLDIRIRRARPWVTHPIVLREIFIMLNVQGYPESHLRVVRPGDRRTVDDRAIINAMWR
jgi:hypothetical protein